MNPSALQQTQILAAKMALDTARRVGNLLQAELAEAAMNDLLDRSYHTYHASKGEK